MTELTKDLAVDQTTALITSYSFDLQGYTIAEWISLWLVRYHASWVRLATIEALYLGRYKVVSIEQILHVWSRLGSPNIHFTHEFERLICRKLPRHLVNRSESSGENLTQANEVTSELQTNSSTRSEAAPASPRRVSSPQVRPSSTMSERVADVDPQKPDPPSPVGESHQTQTPVPSPTPIAQEKDHFKLSDGARPRQGGDGNDNYHATAYRTPIDCFNPLPDVSPLFYKLKAVAQQKLEEE